MLVQPYVFKKANGFHCETNTVMFNALHHIMQLLYFDAFHTWLQHKLINALYSQFLQLNASYSSNFYSWKLS